MEEREPVARTPADAWAPSDTRPVEEVALALIAVLDRNTDPHRHPLDRYLDHAYLREVLQRAAKLMTVECGLDLATLADEGMKPGQIRDLLAAQGVTITPDGVAHLIKTGREKSAECK